MIKLFTQHPQETWQSCVSEILLIASIAAILVAGPNGVWSLKGQHETDMPQQTKVAQCTEAREQRESACLHNYYFCSANAQECLKTFNDCRGSRSEQEKHCAAGT